MIIQIKTFFFPSKLCIFFLFISNRSSILLLNLLEWREILNSINIAIYLNELKKKKKTHLNHAVFFQIFFFFFKILCSLSKLRSSRILHQTERTYSHNRWAMASTRGGIKIGGKKRVLSETFRNCFHRCSKGWRLIGSRAGKLQNRQKFWNLASIKARFIIFLY